MATGTGKTTVMGMLAAWSILNKINHLQDKRFSDTVLILCPNVTIRSRLDELDPNRDEASLYRTRELVPAHRMPELRRGEVIITNWHNLERRELNTVNGQSAKVVKRGMPVTRIVTKKVEGEKIEVTETKYYESDQAFINRILGKSKGRSQHILVFNDEGHHAYRRGDIDIVPFVRYEDYNTQESVAAGFTVDPINDEDVVTAGLSFYVHPQVVFKFDVQDYGTDDTKDRFNVGLGWMF